MKILTPILLSLGVCASQAATIVIANSDFENPTAGGFPQATSWLGDARIADHASFGPGSSGSLGLNFAFNQGSNAPAEQSLAAVYTASTIYTLQSFAVNNGDNPDITYTLGYIDGGSVFQTLNTATNDLAGVAAWTLQDGVSYTTGASGSEIGENIVVRIESTVLQGVWFDEVSLTSVPEPSSAILLSVCGFAGMIRRRS